MPLKTVKGTEEVIAATAEGRTVTVTASMAVKLLASVTVSV